MKALFIDTRWCYGCHGCELACQSEHGMEVGQTGILVSKIGVWPYMDDGKEEWQFSYMPTPTNQCDGCSQLTAGGDVPACVKHCFANCLEYGEVEELAKKLDTPNQCLYTIA